MKVSFHEDKRAKTLAERGLDFADAATVFDGSVVTVEDDRRDYGERRQVTYGHLGSSLVAVVWTERRDSRHIISMRKCNDREKRRFEHRLD